MELHIHHNVKMTIAVLIAIFLVSVGQGHISAVTVDDEVDPPSGTENTHDCISYGQVCSAPCVDWDNPTTVVLRGGIETTNMRSNKEEGQTACTHCASDSAVTNGNCTQNQGYDPVICGTWYIYTLPGCNGDAVLADHYELIADTGVSCTSVRP